MIIDETFTDAKSEAEREIYSTTEKIEYSQEYNSDEPMVFILDDLNEKEINVPKNKARFKQSRHNNVSIIIINQDNYDFPGRTVRANTNIYHILNSNNFRDVQNLYQDKASMDMTHKDFNLSTSLLWDGKYQPLTNGLTNDKFTGCYRLGLKSLFVRHSSHL